MTDAVEALPIQGSRNLARMQIRPMELRDLERVWEIDQRSFSLPWPKRSYLYELLQNPASLHWVAEVYHANPENMTSSALAGTVVGMIVVWIIEDEAHIATLAVDPDYRSLGIGKEMLRFTLRQLVLRGVHMATLEVRANNDIAKALYRKFGFKEVGRRPRYYQDNNEDAVIMTVTGLGNSYLEALEA